MSNSAKRSWGSKFNSKFKEFSTYAAVQTTSYALLTVNFRAVASSRLPLALLTDGVNATLSFFIIRRIAKSEDSLVGWLGYLIGSLIGTTLGMWIDRRG